MINAIESYGGLKPAHKRRPDSLCDSQFIVSIQSFAGNDKTGYLPF